MVYHTRPLLTLQLHAYLLQELVLMVGCICCDSEGRLNERSILLEGSVQYSGGQQARLDLSKVQACSLFPGQVR